jgi:fructose-bisphosphate aldolase class II
MAIVTLKEVLHRAEAGSYGVGMFNAINIETIQAVLMAAEEKKSPVIIGIPEVDWWYVDPDMVLKALAEGAGSCSVPVVLHYDHGHNLEFMKRLLDHGWTSLMIDESRQQLEKNIELTSRVVELAKPFGASVEAELGHVPFEEGGSGNELMEAPQEMYTKPEEAVYFAEQTGIDALAVAVGTVHGEFRFKPKLNFRRLAEISESLDIPLVLHGGSGLSDEDFKKCIQLGVRKINVFTEIMLEPGKLIKRKLAEAPSWKLEYHSLMGLSITAMKEAVMRNMDVFGSSGKA